jgi:hypothetical protein
MSRQPVQVCAGLSDDGAPRSSDAGDSAHWRQRLLSPPGMVWSGGRLDRRRVQTAKHRGDTVSVVRVGTVARRQGVSQTGRS